MHYEQELINYNQSDYTFIGTEVYYNTESEKRI